MEPKHAFGGAVSDALIVAVIVPRALGVPDADTSVLFTVRVQVGLNAGVGESVDANVALGVDDAVTAAVAVSVGVTVTCVCAAETCRLIKAVGVSLPADKMVVSIGGR